MRLHSHLRHLALALAVVSCATPAQTVYQAPTPPSGCQDDVSGIDPDDVESSVPQGDLTSCALIDGMSQTTPLANSVYTDSSGGNGRGPICYHAAGAVPYTWAEPSTNCTQTLQVFYFYPAKTFNMPLVVFFHANGDSPNPDTNTPSYQDIIAQAMTAGWNVASVQFRHPVEDAYLAKYDNTLSGQPPQNDVGIAISYLRQHAKQLNKFDVRHVASVGYSRGTLAIWQSVQPDIGSPLHTPNDSSLVSAVYAYQGQATNRCDDFGQKYITDPNTWIQGCINGFGTTPDGLLLANKFRSTLTDLGITPLPHAPPPLQITYSAGFHQKADGSINTVAAWNFNPANPNAWPIAHYPNQGLSLCLAYQQAGYGSLCVQPREYADWGETDPTHDKNDAFYKYTDWLANFLNTP